MGGSFAFVCAKEDEQGPDGTHRTSIVMRRCSRCRTQAVAGYWCDEEGCGHEDVDPVDQLVGHGADKCDAARDLGIEP